MIVGALPLMLSIGFAQAGGDSACEAAMRGRDEAFRPLAAEMAKLRKDGRRHKSVNDYSPLQMAGRYAEFQEKLKAFARRYPYRDCAKGKSRTWHQAVRHAELASASSAPQSISGLVEQGTPDKVRGDGGGGRFA